MLQWLVQWHPAEGILGQYSDRNGHFRPASRVGQDIDQSAFVNGLRTQLQDVLQAVPVASLLTEEDTLSLRDICFMHHQLVSTSKPTS